MRFSLIDRITELQAGQSLTAVKNLTMAEEYLGDHFPGFPVMPGVLMLESLVQAGAWLVRYTEDFAYSTVLLKEARAVKFNNFVSPGKTLTVSVRLQKWDGPVCVLKGEGTVDGQSTVSARLFLHRFNLAERNPELKRVDERLVQHWRELFEQIWQPTSSTEQAS